MDDSNDEEQAPEWTTPTMKNKHWNGRLQRQEPKNQKKISLLVLRRWSRPFRCLFFIVGVTGTCLVVFQFTMDLVLGYHLEWELSGEVVSGDTDKSKEPGKWKPIWKVPSKEVATIFDSTTRTRISETGAGELDNMTFRGEGPPIWLLESYRRKRTYVLELGTRGKKTIVAPNTG
ncbi:hypothetical protein C2G38_2165099 [Gigaspora rosea]|uniref:Uncharacterized protein n=1 Tax=Gigaspora rosea TaxID=44941 RepID=A0A397VT91_9GLOM|nr:hypothetical protein C2G38_2165099 [Gigaspora rosea]